MPLTAYINRVIHGDCLEILKGLPDKCVDLVLTDPPYGVGFADWDSLVDISWLTEAQRVGLSVVFTPGIKNMWTYPSPSWVGSYSCPNGEKRSAGGGINAWEPLLIYGKNPFPLDHKQFRPHGQPQIYDHPCPKPIAPFLWIVGSTCDPEGVILDPFCGSGTTLVAAKMLGRRYIGIDIEKKYCDIAEERLRNTTPPLPFKTEKQEQGCLL